MYIKGFIANLEKHLEGELIGEWITFLIKLIKKEREQCKKQSIISLNPILKVW